MLAKYYLFSIPLQTSLFLFTGMRLPLAIASTVRRYVLEEARHHFTTCETWQCLQTAGGAHQRSLSEAMEHWGVIGVWFMSAPWPPRCSISKRFLLIRASTEIASQTQWQALQTWIDNPLALAGVTKLLKTFWYFLIRAKNAAVNLSELVHPSQELPCKLPATVGSGVVSFGGALIAHQACALSGWGSKIYKDLLHHLVPSFSQGEMDMEFLIISLSMIMWWFAWIIWIVFGSYCSLQLLWGERTCPAGQLEM